MEYIALDAHKGAPGPNCSREEVTDHKPGVTTTLPGHHRDPFDRLLVAQAIHEPARLVTTDRRLAVYSDLVQVIA
jgi:PIN domain nuclease of toxin-antitoxin system